MAAVHSLDQNSKSTFTSKQNRKNLITQYHADTLEPLMVEHTIYGAGEVISINFSKKPSLEIIFTKDEERVLKNINLDFSGLRIQEPADFDRTLSEKDSGNLDLNISSKPQLLPGLSPGDFVVAVVNGGMPLIGEVSGISEDKTRLELESLGQTSLKSLIIDGKSVEVLGDMRELGNNLSQKESVSEFCIDFNGSAWRAALWEEKFDYETFLNQRLKERGSRIRLEKNDSVNLEVVKKLLEPTGIVELKHGYEAGYLERIRRRLPEKETSPVKPNDKPTEPEENEITADTAPTIPTSDLNSALDEGTSLHLKKESVPTPTDSARTEINKEGWEGVYRRFADKGWVFGREQILELMRRAPSHISGKERYYRNVLQNLRSGKPFNQCI